MGTYPPPPPPPVSPVGDGRKKGYGLALAWIIVSVLAILGLCFWGIYSCVARFTDPFGDLGGFNPGRVADAPPAGVHVGDRPAWRELRLTSEMPFGGSMPTFASDIVVGDFDGDGGDELICDTMMTLALLELNGTQTNIDSEYGGMLTGTAWDSDGDGAMEALYMDYSNAGYCLTDVRGERQTLPFQMDYISCSGVGDFDGDGRVELMINGSAGPEVSHCRILNQDGQVIYENVDDDVEGCADTDGDGVSELLIVERWRSTKIIAKTIAGVETEYTGWPGDYSFNDIGGYGDIDGDGCDEVFASNHGYLNPATAKFTEFKYPDGIKPENGYQTRTLALDFDGDGALELVTTASLPDALDSGVYVFKSTGECIYYEEMGEYITAFLVATDTAGVDHLVVGTYDRLVVYP